MNMDNNVMKAKRGGGEGGWRWPKQGALRAICNSVNIKKC